MKISDTPLPFLTQQQPLFYLTLSFYGKNMKPIFGKTSKTQSLPPTCQRHLFYPVNKILNTLPERSLANCSPDHYHCPNLFLLPFQEISPFRNMLGQLQGELFKKKKEKKANRNSNTFFLV